MSLAQPAEAQHDAPKDATTTLFSAAQEVAFNRLIEAVHTSPLVLLEGASGAGKTTLLTELARRLNGVRLDGRDILASAANAAHPCIEEQFYTLVENALAKHDLVVVDDMDPVLKMAVSPGYARPGFLNVPVRALIDAARDTGKHIVFAATSFWIIPEFHMAPELAARAASVEMPTLDARDFAHFFSLKLSPRLRQSLDADQVFQYAPTLNVYQLIQLSSLLERNARADASFVRDAIDAHILQSNTKLDEVATVTFDDLKGFEDIIDKLTTFVINPLTFDSRFAKIGLKPKRGVLLYGPPGTGKTSIGRALAHQMKGKFFLIDGTFTTEPADMFFRRVKQVFEAAKRATPSVIFIDDADVLFQSDRSTSLNRYLLTMLDGLESETANKVAVIMTAMDPTNLPVPLLRSGRVELWLETKAPAENTRTEIIAAHVAGLPAVFRQYDPDRIAHITEGFNAADMRRVVADVKALYASDKMEGRAAKSVDEYFTTSADLVRKNRELLHLAEIGQLGGFAASDRTASATDRKASRLRDEMSQCDGE